MAKSDDSATQDLVAFALRAVADSKHPDVRRDALAVVAALPPAKAARLAPLVCAWLGEDNFIFGAHFTEEIMKRLVTAGEQSACLTVMRGLYRLSVRGNEIRTSFTSHMYEHSIFTMTPALTSALGLDALRCYCDLLYEAALITEKIRTDPPWDHTTFSSLPLPRTEMDQHDVYGALTGAVLRSASKLIEEAREDGHLINDSWPARDFVQLMRPLYEEEVGRLTSDIRDEEREFREDRFGEYLAVLQFWGELPNDLLVAFLRDASDRLRRHVMWFVGRELSSPKLPKEMRERALAYWEMRLEAGISANDKEEFRGELGVISAWDNFSTLDTKWLLTQQTRMFGAGFTPSNAYGVVEWAAKIAPEYPDEVVEMMEALFKNPKTDQWSYITNHAPIRTALMAGLASMNATTHERVQRIIAYLASMGDTSFLDLAKK